MKLSPTGEIVRSQPIVNQHLRKTGTVEERLEYLEGRVEALHNVCCLLIQWANRTATPEDYADAVGLLVQNKEWTEAMLITDEMYDSRAKDTLNDLQRRLLHFAIFQVDGD